MLKKISTIFFVLLAFICASVPVITAQSPIIPKPKQPQKITNTGNNKSKHGRKTASKKNITSSNTKPSPKRQKKELYGYEGDYVWVDLGLPSGVKWATCNVGAYDETELGDYYAWGEVREKASYKSDNYTGSDIIKRDISGDPLYDVARAEWGYKWRMPTKDDVDELRAFTTAEWTEKDGVEGLLLKSKKNDMYIFLPAAGYKFMELRSSTDFGAYWTSTKYDDGAYCAIINEDDKLGQNAYAGFAGFSIRPVCN